eukprot:TRINITY_DN189_c0_g1_i2.p1 TRINITY_DN189_c0_g1~~TRINITY_DN189_c0_g1_i2.p1  ORF type:complete len:267 (-),score=89.74 TRINITY_DN189_c0_g1_i2:63-863(-)
MCIRDRVSTQSTGKLTVKPLQLELNPDIKSGIQAAVKKFNTLQNEVSLTTLDFSHFGKEEIKAWKVSPDAVCQLSYQNAFNFIHNFVAPTYESGNTKSFLRGRTETIRSATPASTALVKAVVKGSSDPELAQLLRDAAAAHSAVVKESLSGFGWDRHIFSMRNLNAKLGRPALSICNDPNYQQMLNILLSTSTLSSDACTKFGFGAVTTDGYGIGYGINDHSLHFTITNFKSNQIQGDVNLLSSAINDSLLRFKSLLSAHPARTPA